MNFDDAVSAHVNWKMRLRSFIDGISTEKLDPTVIEKDNQCALGKWIYGEGAGMCKTASEFETLKSEHARFHKCAASIVRKVTSGDKGGATTALDGNEYGQLSNKVVSLIMTLKKRLS